MDSLCVYIEIDGLMTKVGRIFGNDSKDASFENYKTQSNQNDDI